MAFSPSSESFYGDVAQVKVAARRDATPEEAERLRQLASQVLIFCNLNIIRFFIKMNVAIILEDVSFVIYLGLLWVDVNKDG